MPVANIDAVHDGLVLVLTTEFSAPHHVIHLFLVGDLDGGDALVELALDGPHHFCFILPHLFDLFAVNDGVLLMLEKLLDNVLILLTVEIQVLHPRLMVLLDGELGVSRVRLFPFSAAPMPSGLFLEIGIGCRGLLGYLFPRLFCTAKDCFVSILRVGRHTF